MIRIAIPVVNGKLSQHFGHCHSFTLLDIDDAAGSVVARQNTPAPPHEPGALPRWLAEQDVNLVVTGGMGNRARRLFSASGIEVVVGAPSGDPVEIAQAYLDGTLETTGNACDH